MFCKNEVSLIILDFSKDHHYSKEMRGNCNGGESKGLGGRQSLAPRLSFAP